MPETALKFVSLSPTVLDYNRVVLTLRTDGFASVPNVVFNFDSPAEAPNPSGSVPSGASYPNVDLTLVDEHGQIVSQITIIEHRQAELSLTLHLRRPQPDHPYTARAEMKDGETVLHTLGVSFILKIPPADQEA